jgi:hypothetical protein
MTEQHARAIFLLADLSVEAMYELPDGYIRERGSPWWLVQTPYGLIKIGWRKRVIDIDWSGTSVRAIVTEHSVTKEDTMVHAWSYARAVEYLAEWRRLAKRAKWLAENPPEEVAP